VVVLRPDGALYLFVTVSDAATPLRAVHLDLRMGQPSGSSVLPDQRILLDGREVGRVRLLDDGRGGDAAPGDGRFTSAALFPREEPARPLVSRFALEFTGIGYEFSDTTLERPFSPLQRPVSIAYAIDSAGIHIPNVIEVGGLDRRTAHVVALVMPLPSPVFPAPDRGAVAMARRYYEVFKYDPDFIVIHQLDFTVGNGTRAYYAGVQNTREGLGLTQFDHRREYGSPDGKLQGVVVAQSGPDPFSHSLTIHELGHRWMAYLDPDLGITAGAHWGPFLDREFSGFDDGRYNDVELYLMGLLPPDSVIPRRVGINGRMIDEVVARHGPRFPSWPDAQVHFRIATVVVHQRPISPVELALFEFLASEFGRPAPEPSRTDTTIRTFFQATGGRAMVTTRIPDDATR
jgi:hypothetical protein